MGRPQQAPRLYHARSRDGHKDLSRCALRTTPTLPHISATFATSGNKWRAQDEVGRLELPSGDTAERERGAPLRRQAHSQRA